MVDADQPTECQRLVRGMGVLQATALNMSIMVGFGVFVTVPLMIAAMGGPLWMLGWVMGAILALCDGLVWSELAAAMPGTGGTYLYLREAFQKTRVGQILPFLFIWQFLFSAPLELASGAIGCARYAGYLLQRGYLSHPVASGEFGRPGTWPGLLGAGSIAREKLLAAPVVGSAELVGSCRVQAGGRARVGVGVGWPVAWPKM